MQARDDRKGQDSGNVEEDIDLEDEKSKPDREQARMTKYPT